MNSGRQWAYTQQVGPMVTQDPPIMDAVLRRMRAEAAVDAWRKGVTLDTEPVLTVAFQRTEWVDGEPSSWPVKTADEATEVHLRLIWDVAEA